MEDKELYNPQSGEKIAPKKPKEFWKDWHFYVYTLIALMLAIVSFSSCLTACAAINAGVGEGSSETENSSLVSSVKKAYYDDGFLSSYGTGVGMLYNYSGAMLTFTVSGGDYECVDTNVSSSHSLQLSAPLSARPSSLSVGIFVYGYQSGYFDFYVDGVFVDTYALGYVDGTNVNYVPFDISAASNYSHYWIFDHNAYDLGYSDGYEVGSSEGYSSGYEVGYSDGSGYGYGIGYADGANSATYFSSLGVKTIALNFSYLSDDQADYTNEVGLKYFKVFAADVGGVDYYFWLCYYTTVHWSQWDVYPIFCTSSTSSGFTLDYLKNNSLGVWGIPLADGAYSANNAYFVYNPVVKSYDDARVTSVYIGSLFKDIVVLSGGKTEGDIYSDAYGAGYDNGYSAGYRLGEVAGANSVDPESLTNTLVTVFQQPFNQIYRFFNFNVLGLNILGLATGLLSIFIIIKVFKKVLK